MVKLEKITIFPIKSVSGLECNTHPIISEGFKYDREWMIVKPDGTFLTQREMPQLNQLGIVSYDEGFYIFNPNDKSSGFQIIANQESDKIIEVNIWDQECLAQTGFKDSSAWLSDYLCKEVILVKIKKRSRIRKSNSWEFNFPINFSDGYPIHLVNLNSIKQVEVIGNTQIDPKQFRSNLLISGLPPFEEDKLKGFKIGNLSFDVIKKCGRCIMTNLKPNTSKFGKEPLRTLSTFRKFGIEVYFGIYAIPRREAGESVHLISISDELILEF